MKFMRRAWMAPTTLVCSLLIFACGGSSEQQPPADPLSFARDNPVTAMQRGLEAMTVIYDDIAEIIDSVDDEDSANAAAQRLRTEIVPRAGAVASGMIAAMSSAGTFSEDEIAVWESEVDVERFQRAENEHEEAVYRMSDSLERIYILSHLITPELQAALEVFGDTMMAMEQGMAEALLVLD